MENNQSPVKRDGLLAHSNSTDREKGMLQRPFDNGCLYSQTPVMPNATQVNYISVENIDEYITKVTMQEEKS
jgi:hypothetical protein